MDSDDTRIVSSQFQPPKWLKNRHFQTILASMSWVWPSRPQVRREALELPDGDVTAVDWLVAADEFPKTSPLLVVLHGLEGSAESPYARMMLDAARDRGWHGCVLHFRDCGDYRNLLPRRYHAGETNDLRHFLSVLQGRGFTGPVMAVGFSLGGNVLLKYLGESGSQTPLRAACAVCVPLDLHECAVALNTGLSKGYQRYLLKRMKTSVTRKFDRHTAAFDWQQALGAKTFAEFDDVVTAPLHGFDSGVDYYDKCSSVRFLDSIEKPTLIINALDDPFMTPGVIPHRDRLSEHVCLEVSEYGGHVGFIDGGTPRRPSFYLPGRLTEFLQPHAAMPGM
jgi:predicted alpha/beta-fold hydrolase